ncbi:cysteine proteinase [Dichomitus squalens LYAD-421 SS1]|uniref:Ubiquitin carboxyl-terminal hydrolase n=1 Tax=Dichomitus squalens (strain LYAD-421) TaxID=732165 RepID=R7STQ2_DICSQ|nr:cysteine proteinase [Dichomitus squalens LYAD-421 SS1]EJF59278.1 cysteine proteinase [Dichomitus squalens LYAD-421 SS1]
MAPISVKIKHAGKVHDVQLDPDQPATLFKDAVYQLTGVPPDRMKVMIKGGILKDDTDWRKVAPKAGQTFMVIGAAGELPKPPSTPIQFMEDMDDTSLAQALALPVGLVNLGNTCYMNATLQAMRAIPELQAALQHSAPTGLPFALRNLYSNMAKTTDSVTPTAFLAALRQAFPQFAEQSRATGLKLLQGGVYAQQDAEECWVQLTNSLKDVQGLPGPSSESATGKFVEQYMTGELRRTLKLKESEASDEPESVSYEKVLKISCNISNAVNYMQQGIMEALDGEIEKQSPSLGREAVYTSTQRLSRLPTYLTVHMVRFAWKRDIGKKAKIMRRVKFPTEYDALEIATPELAEKLLPASRKLKVFEKERSERRKVRKRTKVAVPAKDKEGDVQMGDAAASAASSSASASEPAAAAAAPAEGSAEGDKGKAVAGIELEDESVYREKEGKELEALIHPDLKTDVGASVTGQYELVAIVTHKGAEADAGHYIGFVKKRALHSNLGTTPAGPQLDEDDEDWYKFDDDKVSIFPAEKLETLSGGGQDASAYVLLYKARPLV